MPSSPPQAVPEPYFTPHKPLLRQTYLNHTSTSRGHLSPLQHAPSHGGNVEERNARVNTFNEFWLTQFVQNKYEFN